MLCYVMLCILYYADTDADTDTDTDADTDTFILLLVLPPSPPVSSAHPSSLFSLHLTVTCC